MREVLYDADGVIRWEGNLNEGDSLTVRKITKQQKQWSSELKSGWLSDMNFGKIYIDMMEYINKEVTPSVWMFFCRLMKYTCYNDCVLRIGGRANGKALSTYQEIADVLGESYKFVYRNMTALIGAQLIAVATTGSEDNDNMITVYLMNPYLFFRGKDIQKSVIKEFRDCKWAKYNELVTKKG